MSVEQRQSTQQARKRVSVARASGDGCVLCKVLEWQLNKKTVLWTVFLRGGKPSRKRSRPEKTSGCVCGGIIQRNLSVCVWDCQVICRVRFAWAAPKAQSWESGCGWWVFGGAVVLMVQFRDPVCVFGRVGFLKHGLEKHRCLEYVSGVARLDT